LRQDSFNPGDTTKYIMKAWRIAANIAKLPELLRKP
jgi:hypothetical protein